MKTRVQVVTIAARRGEITSTQGPKTVADYGYDDTPHLDLILVPGGMGAFQLIQDIPTLKWLREKAKEADIVMSVCNGASLLAAAGILNGHSATTNKMLWKMSTERGAKWIKKARWVDDGTVVTSSGVSAGINMTLAVIARLYGKDIADQLAKIIEYEPHDNPNWDPFAKRAGLID